MKWDTSLGEGSDERSSTLQNMLWLRERPQPPWGFDESQGPPASSEQARNMAGAGFHPHPAPFTHRFLGKALGATMWFWIFYRAKQDGGKLLGQHPWGHGDHGSGHGEHH
ncbi:hypothetical protein DL93DRAFT_2093541 [Clavulina sp. PMI_390]|nr:hypothetical protein DL93DRAFT_2093541 [Clavulina sp. PMI_390]